MIKVLSILLLLTLFSAAVLAWEDCPYGEVNDPYPGKCGRYTDTDSNHICDLSEPAPSDRISYMENAVIEENVVDSITREDFLEKTVEEISSIYEIDLNQYINGLSEYYDMSVRKIDSFNLLQDNYGIEPNIAKDIAVAIREEGDIPKPESNAQNKTYHLIPISAFLIIAYIISHTLRKKKIITLARHRMLWNVPLLVISLITGLSGILLVIRINFGIAPILPFNILFWHVETGIAATVICTFHVIERRYYFINLMKKKKK